ncbi:4Fe-4S dicluster domain-containing protein [bacterium]|nr:4Fe-4S dicluster domain-containing protein [bacterium]
MQKAIYTDLNRCVGCLACSVACKALNGVEIGNFWNRVVRVGPNPEYEGADYPDVYMYFLPVTCQHCADAPCVAVCPTGASQKTEDGTVQIDKETCIGCGACLDACPYGVRYINSTTNVAEKCTFCNENIDDDGVPQCVSQCGGNARWVGDLDEGLESFVGAYDTDGDYGGERRRMMDFIEPFTDDQVYALPDEGNGPSMRYILRGHTWYGSEAGVEGTTIAAGGFENTTAGGNTTVANVSADGEAAKAASASKE